MPIETIVVVAAIVGVFALFSITLAWADQLTRRKGRQSKKE